jgi:hypothetical protein
VERTGEGRAINRHDFTGEQVQAALDRPVVTRVVDLVRLRNTHPVFEGEFCVETDDDRSIRLRWQNGEEVLALDVDFVDGRAALTSGGRRDPIAAWSA